MSSQCRHRFLLIALTGACSCALGWQAARAAPPLTKIMAQVGRGNDVRPEASNSVRLPQSRLDLAAPAMAPQSFERPAALGFPATHRPLSDLRAGLPTLGAHGDAATAQRTLSRPEMLVRNFRHEGLPVAKLFQSENSLVHIGLSPKGKPGLWIVEKLH